MLERFFEEGLGLAQAGAVMVLVLAVVLVARWRDIHLERETAVAVVRGLIQIIAVGSVLVILLQGPAWTSVLVLAGMMFAGAAIAARRARGIVGISRRWRGR